MMVMEHKGSLADDGHTLGFWYSGHIIYGCCVLIANIVLFLKFNIHHWSGVLMFILMIMAYFLFFFVQSLFMIFPQIWLLFTQAFSQPLTWICILFSVLCASAFELAIRIDQKQDDIFQVRAKDQ